MEEVEIPVVPTCVFVLNKDDGRLESGGGGGCDFGAKPQPAQCPSLQLLSVGGGGGAWEDGGGGGGGGGAAPRAPGTPSAIAEGDPRAATLLCERLLVLEALEGSTLHRCVDVRTREELVCKVACGREAGALLLAHARLAGEPGVCELKEALPLPPTPLPRRARSLLQQRFPGAPDAHAHEGSASSDDSGGSGSGNGRLCLVFERACGGDLHTYVRARRRLREADARRLFRQAARAVEACHRNGLVLRDLKLRKFVFADAQRMELKLETLEDAVLLEDPEDDRLEDKRGCPAYVSPEILRCHAAYSGRAADMWSLGVILYTMLVGRYPFNDSEHASLFAKISRAQFVLPEWLSAKARCLIRSLLRRDPQQRMAAGDVLLHPWLQDRERDFLPCLPSPGPSASPNPGRSNAHDGGDQVVPEFCP